MTDNLIVVGNDKFGRKLISIIEKNNVNVSICLDKSSSLLRVFYLLVRRKICWKCCLKIGVASIFRKNYLIGKYPIVRNNNELKNNLYTLKPQKVYFFRAGIIVSKELLQSYTMINIHCADIKKYPGLGAICKAIKDGVYDQVATMHKMTQKIDAGDIVATKPYHLGKGLSFRKNEEIAYEAGIRLLCEYLKITV